MVANRPLFLDIDLAPLQAFRSSHPEITSKIQELLWLEWVLFSLACHSSESFTGLTISSIQQIHEYNREAALLCMRGRANIGLALTRMACELSRDVLRFARNIKAQKIWTSRKTNSKEYRKIFQFNASPAERMLFGVYKIASSFGIHGHILITELAESDVCENREEFVRLRPETKFALDCLSLNLSAVQIFVMAFLSEHGRVFLESQDPSILEDAKQLAYKVCTLEFDPTFLNRPC